MSIERSTESGAYLSDVDNRQRVRARQPLDTWDGGDVAVSVEDFAKYARTADSRARKQIENRFRMPGAAQRP
jgi:hypothetical protein